MKVWLAVTKDEQLRRFKEREATKFKQYKITPDDWRNRKKWDDYIVAGSDMIDRTSTSFAPWHVIEANDKHLARVRVIEAITGRDGSGLQEVERRRGFHVGTSGPLAASQRASPGENRRYAPTGVRSARRFS